MAKRGPQSELTDSNWDDEEEPEEAGIFKQATQEAIQQRVIKKAKRRVPDEGSGGKAGAFGGFGGLVSKTPLTQSSIEKAPGVKPPAFGSDSMFKSSVTGGATSSLDHTDNSKKDSKENSSYLLGLKALNESVLAWIKQHVDKNPYIILTPIFKDYETYLATIESKKSATNGSGKPTNVGESNMFTSSDISTKPLDDLGSKKESTDVAKSQGMLFNPTSSNGDGSFKFSMATATTNSGFNFGKGTGFSFSQTGSTSSSTTTAPSSVSFSFGSGGGMSTSSATTTTPSSGFSFGTGSTTPAFGNSGFSFGNLAAKTIAQGASGNTQDGEDDEYVPPKPEVKEVKEEGSLYSKRCKLFYQKEGEWKDRGVGNVHLKPIEGSKTQLLVRADTNLGNILLNINVTSALPTSRSGKNNVMLVCVPNPPLKEGKEDPTPIPMLIRVKTGEEADELLAKLEERKALL